MGEKEMDKNRPLGKNVKALAAMKSAREAIPDGGGLADGIDFIRDQERFKRVTLESFQWAFQAIDAVKAAPDNPYGDDDEIIAGAILDEIEKKRGKIDE